MKGQYQRQERQRERERERERENGDTVNTKQSSKETNKLANEQTHEGDTVQKDRVKNRIRLSPSDTQPHSNGEIG